MHKKDIELLKLFGFDVECESPFEIRHNETDSFAEGKAAEMVLEFLKIKLKEFAEYIIKENE